MSGDVFDHYDYFGESIDCSGDDRNDDYPCVGDGETSGNNVNDSKDVEDGESDDI